MTTSNEGIVPNANRLLWAGFMAILATGVGFAIRGGILANWGAEFGFNGAQLGEIGAGGLTGFCFGVIIGGVVADTIGYGWLILAALILHIISAVVTFAAGPGMSADTAFQYLKWGTFIFALANGTLESVANPLVATLFPQNRTHYLNILHASWPAGLALGGIAGALLGNTWSWKAQLALFLVPTALYALMFLGQKFPKSEASAKGVPFTEMFKDVGILGGLVICALFVVFFKDAIGLPPKVAYSIGGALLLAVAVVSRFAIGAILLFVLFITHAMVGSVELGTDGWIQNITGNILDPVTGKWLFVYTSAIMFALRFCAHFIEKTLKVSPVGLLTICAITACIGLNLISRATGTVMVMAALAVYALGKTFFWPTMLAVASDRFPRSGAIAISIMGGIGMMAGGLVGAKGLGFAKDRFAGEYLQSKDPALYAEYKSPTPSDFLFLEPVYGLDGKKLGEVAAAKERTDKQKLVAEANSEGDRKTLVADSALPAAMAVIYLLVLIYFKTIGGYKPIHVEDERAHDHA